MIEFALVALATSLILAATVDFGRLVFNAQALQDVARIAARELSILPLPAESTFDEAMASCPVRQKVFDPTQLVIDITSLDDAQLDALYGALPPVNQALRPLMISEQVTVNGASYKLLRYPGALMQYTAGTAPACSDMCVPSSCNAGILPSAFTVGIPRVTARSATGVETIEWVPILAEVRSNPADPAIGPFSIASTGPQQGLVALMVNYPFQAAMMTGFRTARDENGNPLPFEPNVGNYNIADDGSVDHNNDPAELLTLDEPAVTYAGPFGLGRQLAFAGQTVRPYRNLITAQAIYRREVFE